MSEQTTTTSNTTASTSTSSASTYSPSITSKTLADSKALQEKIKATLESDSLEKKWEEFQNSYARLGEALGRALTGSLGLPQTQIVAQPSRIPFTSSAANNNASKAVAAVLMKARKILVLCGAGISVGAGIKDFRSKDGLYDTLRKKNLSELENPEDFFTPDFIRNHPELFYQLSQELGFFPEMNSTAASSAKSKSSPTPTTVHKFFSYLASLNKLGLVITSNIDGLELAAGCPKELVLAAHGSFSSETCRCLKRFGNEKDAHDDIPMGEIYDALKEGKVPRCKKCTAVLCPKVTLFGESLPKDFSPRKDEICNDPELDAMLIIGSSLKVAPTSLVPMFVQGDVPRVLINMELPVEAEKMFNFDHWKKKNYSQVRDVLLQGDCQTFVEEIWKEMERLRKTAATTTTTTTSKNNTNTTSKSKTTTTGTLNYLSTTSKRSISTTKKVTSSTSNNNINNKKRSPSRILPSKKKPSTLPNSATVAPKPKNSTRTQSSTSKSRK